MRPTKTDTARGYAECIAREHADQYRQPYLVFYEYPDAWRVCPMGSRRDPGPYTAGCASYSVHPARDRN